MTRETTVPTFPLMSADAPPVVLASASVARARLLAAAGVRVDVRPPAVDEAALKEALRADRVPAADAAVAIADLKARRVAVRVPPEALVIGADQLLNLEEAWLDKPESIAGARAQLERLAGRRHQLWAAAVVMQGGQRIWHQVSEARLWMRELSSGYIEQYLQAAGEAALSSVGAYQLEGLGAQLFARVEGDHFVVQGLPLLPLLEFLRVRGVLRA